MEHARDGHPSAGDALPDLPTEFGWPHPQSADARPDLPTEIAHPYPQAADAHADLPTEIALSHPPTYAGYGYRATPTGTGEPDITGPSYTPAHGRPSGQPARAGLTDPAAEFTRSGPGVPVPPPTRVPHTAERIWRSGRPAEPPWRPRRWRGLAGAAFTVILLAASAVVLYQRVHHTPFQVTGVAITQRTQSGCGLNLTGQISTNGAAGTVSYRWLFRPGQQAPQLLSQSLVAGQDTVDVSVALQGSGHGRASRAVILQILGPGRRAASTSVTIRC
jgi:hypothetical protein